ncbi:TOBE domain-containing protein, partial [Pandoraea nosoerga]|nr:TOBE domain-containing protein [Pandoraea nosoerga]
IGTPREVYFAPKDRFVAEFIGAANIVEAPVENGLLILPGGRLPIEGGATSANATVMIRPETIRVTSAGAEALSGVVDSVSFIGDRQRLVVSGGWSKGLKVDGDKRIQAKVGDRVGLSIAHDGLRILQSEPWDPSMPSKPTLIAELS